MRSLRADPIRPKKELLFLSEAEPCSRTNLAVGINHRSRGETITSQKTKAVKVRSKGGEAYYPSRTDSAVEKCIL